MKSQIQWFAVLGSFMTSLLAHADEPLFTARPLTDEGAFTPGIEGPATDKNGSLFVVNYEKQ
ncbi:MAG: SMP-30/gluconolactonase/LRE family protein, partial [bacterium]